MLVVMYMKERERLHEARNRGLDDEEIVERMRGIWAMMDAREREAVHRKVLGCGECDRPRLAA